MEARGLRIGNLIRDNINSRDVVVTPELIKDISDWGTSMLMTNPPKPVFKPIPLTEEWLLMFGFNGWDIGHYTLALTNGNFFHIDNESPIARNVKYVHQLQNLYFALTGEELKLKD